MDKEHSRAEQWLCQYPVTASIYYASTEYLAIILYSRVSLYQERTRLSGLDLIAALRPMKIMPSHPFMFMLKIYGREKSHVRESVSCG